MVAKRFFYVCAGLLCLALAYHFGATSATAQAPGNPIVGFAGSLACTENGDVYGITGTNPLMGNGLGSGTSFPVARRLHSVSRSAR